MDVITILLNQQVASLEHDARQPRLAIEADGPANTKTRERTEGAAKEVQVMHGDSCSATRVEPGPKTNSTSFGMMAEPPDLPCRQDVLVEDGAAAFKSCLPSSEMRTTTAAGGLLPTGEISTATKTTFNKSPLRLYSTKETNTKMTNVWTSVPSAWYDRSFCNLLLPLPAGGLLRQNLSRKIERPIQAVLKVVSAPARFWERGARCFVVRLFVLEWLNEAAAFFGGEWYRRDPTPYV